MFFPFHFANDSNHLRRAAFHSVFLFIGCQCQTTKTESYLTANSTINSSMNLQKKKNIKKRTLHQRYLNELLSLTLQINVLHVINYEHYVTHRKFNIAINVMKK